MIGTEFQRSGIDKIRKMPDCGLAILAGSSTPNVEPLNKSETVNLNHWNNIVEAN